MKRSENSPAERLKAVLFACGIALVMLNVAKATGSLPLPDGAVGLLDGTLAGIALFALWKRRALSRARD